MNVEKRSIEFIPEEERGGSVKNLFTIWFSSNMQITALVVGTLGVIMGLNLFWSFLAIILGNLIGGIFMAAHSAQGPHLGIPQLIQSRAQFGVYGAVLPLIVLISAYTLFTAANGIVIIDSIQAVVPVSGTWAIIVFGLLTLVIAFIGHDFIHKMGKYMTIISGVVFALATIIILQNPLPEDMWSFAPETFHWAAFMLVVTQAASWEIGFGPYVADYSRYLPSKVKPAKTFWYTYSGNVIGATTIMLLGALLAANISNFTNSIGSSIAGLFGSFAIIAYIVIILGVLEINVLNLYSAYMSTATMFTSFSGAGKLSQKAKFNTMSIVIFIATVIAIATQHNFNAYFSDILIGQVYLLFPWTSINLADYYFVRHGKYSIPDIYEPNGIYGKYNWTALNVYFLTIILQLPFMSFSFYEGFIAQVLNADLAWIVSLLVPGTLYSFLMKRKVGLQPYVKQSEKKVEPL